jgi:hypothetical protein
MKTHTSHGEGDVRRKLLSVALMAAAGLAIAGPANAGSPCRYKGKGNALPDGGLPVLVYANGDTSPSGYVGIGDGTSNNYGQVSGDSSGVQIEGKSSSAGESGNANSNAYYGSC